MYQLSTQGTRKLACDCFVVQAPQLQWRFFWHQILPCKSTEVNFSKQLLFGFFPFSNAIIDSLKHLDHPRRFFDMEHVATQIDCNHYIVNCIIIAELHSLYAFWPPSAAIYIFKIFLVMLNFYSYNVPCILLFIPLRFIWMRSVLK